jgi:hypothetical protein
MTYVAPQLTLIGHAAGVILGGQPSGVPDSGSQAGTFDGTAYLETEW